MKRAYLVYLAWTVLGILALTAIGVHEHLHPDPDEKFGNPIVFIMVVFAPCYLLGWLAGLGLVALFRDLHPALRGSLAYGGAILTTVALGMLYMKFF